MHRICHVQLLPLMTGVQRVMLGIFDEIDRSRYELHVVCQQPGPLSEELAARDIRCHFMPQLVRPIRPWHDWQAYRALSELFRQHRFDVVHTHSSKPGVVGRLAAWRAGVPCVLHHYHGFAFHPNSPVIKRLIYGAIERYAARHCHGMVFVNDQDREYAVETGIAPPEKCVTVLNGVELDTIVASAHARAQAFRARHGYSAETKLLLVMGRLVEQKQPLIVPAIAARLKELAPREPWKILVAGGGPLQAELECEIDRFGVGNCVDLVGWQDHDSGILQAADIQLHPSLWEGLPLALLESHAVGIPSVASDVKGNREVVTPATGMLCQPHDADGFARELARLIDDADLRRQLGQAARQRAETHFDCHANFQQIVDLYEASISRRRPSSVPVPHVFGPRSVPDLRRAA